MIECSIRIDGDDYASLSIDGSDIILRIGGDEIELPGGMGPEPRTNLDVFVSVAIAARHCALAVALGVATRSDDDSAM